MTSPSVDTRFARKIASVVSIGDFQTGGLYRSPAGIILARVVAQYPHIGDVAARVHAIRNVTHGADPARPRQPVHIMAS